MSIDPKNRSPNQTFGRSAFPPTYDDPAVRHTTRPTNPNYSAPDVEGLPWTRQEGNRWTTPAFRARVLRYVRIWLQRRAPPLLPATWAIEEFARAERGALSPDAYHLVWRVSSGGVDGEVSMPFPVSDREGAALDARLALWGQAMDAAFGIEE